jgi:PAS domain S-box-containing protein
MDSLEPEIKQSLFELLFHQNPQPMWFFDKSTLEFLQVNQAAIDHYGYSRDEFLSMTIKDIRPEGEVDKLLETLHSLSGQTSRRTFSHRLKDGTINHVQIVSYPAPYKNRDARLVMVNDITGNVLHIERFELISKATHDAVWDWNLQTNELWWNNTFSDLFGFGKDQIEPTLEFWTSLIHPEDKERVINSINKSLQNGEEKWSDKYRFRRADGSYAFIIDRAYTIFNNGVPVRMLGSMLDTTLQVELLQAQEETQSMLQKITAASPTALWMSQEQGELIYVNQTWIDWSDNDQYGNLIEGWVKIIHEGDVERVKERYFKAHRDQTSYSIDYRIYFPDGSVRWLTSTANPRYDAEGKFLGLIGSCTDITRQKHLETQKDGFISTVSHELRTPITSIKGYEQLLSRSKIIKDTQGQNFLNRMRVQINRLDTLVQDLLDVSRIEAGTLTFKETSFEVNVLLAEHINDLQLIFPSHRLILVENQHCQIVADKNRIIQLLTNLIDNAVKYSPDADKVLVKLSCDEIYLTVSVEDFGYGILKEQQDFIFDRFYQVNNVYKAPGLGIGLYVCKEIVNRLNGRLWFESTPGAGTTFYFRIPRQ